MHSAAWPAYRPCTVQLGLHTGHAQCSLACIQAMHSAAWPAYRPCTVQLGLHTGHAQCSLACIQAMHSAAWPAYRPCTVQLGLHTGHAQCSLACIQVTHSAAWPAYRLLYYDVMHYVAMQGHARDTHLAAAYFHAESFRCQRSYDLPTMAK